MTQAGTATTIVSSKPGGRPTPRRRSARHAALGWLFIAPFAIVFLVFLVAPLAYAFYLSLYTKGLATGTAFSGITNYITAFTDPSFLGGVWFVVRFSVVLIPVQIGVALLSALLLDGLTTRLAGLSRVMIFIPYAIPAVIGALMWGFLYSPSFGPLAQIFGAIGLNAPSPLSPQNVLGALVNVATWQFAGYYMIIIYAALQGIDPSIYEAAKLDGANARQVALRIKIPMVSSALLLVLVFALIGTLQYFAEPQILQSVSNGSITPTFTPNMYAYNLAFSYSQLNYASTISFALGIVVFIGAYAFILATKRESRSSQ